jgi:hypothetical protein
VAFGSGVLAQIVNAGFAIEFAILPRALMVSGGALIILMVLLFIGMRLTGGAPGPNGPKKFFQWAMAILTTATAILALTSIVFEWPSAFAVYPPSPKSQEMQQELDSLVRAAKEACLIGTQVVFSADLSGNITLINPAIPGDKGQIAVNARKAAGAAEIFDERLRIIADKQIQDCMKPYMEKVFKALLD